MKKPFYILLLSLSFIAFTSTDCKHNPIEPAAPSFSVTDVSCTEAWLHLSYSSAHNTTVILKRNDAVIDTLLLTTTDTTFADTGLLPSHTYQYTTLLDNKTETATAITMDTTNHNFTWQTFTLSNDPIVGSTLFDVAIINDTLAYVVGQIFKQGELIQYCIARWNGAGWTLKRLYYYDNSHVLTTITVPIQGIFVCDTNNIWLTPGSIFRWDGKDSLTELAFNRLTLSNNSATILKIWGTSNSDLYGVGGAGTIIHYNGASWTSINSGISLEIHNIWGAKNNDGNYEILASGGNPLVSSDRAIISLNGTTATILSDNGIPGHYMVYGSYHRNCIG